MSEYLDKPTRSREQYLIDKMRACKATADDYHEWLNMPYEQMTPIRSLNIPQKPPMDLARRQLEARRWAAE